MTSILHNGRNGDINVDIYQALKTVALTVIFYRSLPNLLMIQQNMTSSTVIFIQRRANFHPVLSVTLRPLYTKSTIVVTCGVVSGNYTLPVNQRTTFDILRPKNHHGW